MTFDEVADELYGLDPSDFVATRTERQKQARAAGDKSLARQIGALRKPTTVGWILNALVRDASDEVGELLDLGDALREAQQHVSSSTLRTLTKQRQRAVRALTDRAAALANDRGRPPGDDAVRELTQTLNAALSDSGVADDVRRGRVLGAVEYSGFGPMGLMSVDDRDPEPDTTDDDDDREKEEQRVRAQAELHDAELSVREANDVLAEADRRVEECREAVDTLVRQLEEARGSLTAEEDARSEAAAAVDASTARVRNATKRLERSP